ncbi:MAG: hypothetical protein JWM98_762 [Thermoleophilia bacterium]|nr:hypothetical protein [Thermoleophilia bacterium]
MHCADHPGSSGPDARTPLHSLPRLTWLAAATVLTGGNALVGSLVALLFVAALAVAAVRTRTARLRVAAAAVALAVAGGATALALHLGASDTDALRAFARLGVGTALLFSLPVLVALGSRATRSPAT